MHVFGIQVLEMLDRQEHAERWWRTFRSRIGAANPALIHDVLPEYFTSADNAEEIDRQATAEDGTRDFDRIDESKVVWSTPASDEERESVEAFLAESLARTHTMTSTDLQEGGQWQ